MLGLLLDLAVLAKAAHDIWAATAVYFTVLLMVAVLFAAELWDRDSAGFQIKSFLLALPMLIAFGASFHYSITPSESFSELMDVVFSMAIFFVAQQLFRDRKNIFIFLSVISPLFPLEFLLHLREKLQFGWTVGVSGTLLNSNVSAVFHLFWIPLVVLSAQIFNVENKSTKILIGLVSFCLLGTLALVQSTSALLCIILGLPIMIGWPQLKEWKESNGTWFYGLTFLIGFIFCWFFGIKLSEVFSNHAWRTSYYYTSRFVWWKSGWAMFLDSPWFGVGLGNFPNAYLAYKIGAGVSTLFPHSFIVGLLAETGVVGFFAAGLFFFSWLSAAMRFYDDDDRRPFILGVILVLIFCGFNVGLEYFAILIALAIFMGIASAGTDDLLWKPRKSEAIIVGAVCLFAIPYIVAPFLASQKVVNGYDLLKTAPRSDEAIKYFTDATELDSRSSSAFVGLATTYAQRAMVSHDPKEFETAINYQLRAIERDRLSAQRWWELGAYLEAVGDFAKAKGAYARAAQYDLTNKKFQQDKERLATISASS